MRVFKIHWLYFSALILAFSGCLPQGCQEIQQKLEKGLNEAQLVISKVPFSSSLDLPESLQRDPRDTGTTQTRTPLCTDLIKARDENKEIYFFVDSKAAKHGSGESWKDASKSIGAAIKKALDARQQSPDKRIYVLVAGGTYSQSHEESVLGAGAGFGQNSSLINFEGYSVFFHDNISIGGGYLPDDGCREVEKNDPNYKTNAARKTILDGENKSNHVINISKKAHDIEIRDFTVRGGDAKENKPDENKLMGGAIIVQDASNDIKLTNLVVENSSATKGGCLAIFGENAPENKTPFNVTLTDVTFNNCVSVEGGGGVYLGGDVHTVTMARISIQNSKATGANSLGGGMLIEKNVGAAGEVNISGNISTNKATKFGGGVAIIDDAKQIKFSNITVNGNELTDAAVSAGGGVYIKGKTTAVSFNSGSISGNKAALYGAGVMLTDTTAAAAAGLDAPQPALRFSFNAIAIDGNALLAAGGTARGAGVMLDGDGALSTGTGDVNFNGGSIANNKADGSGVGLAIIGKVHNVDVSGVRIDHNEVRIGKVYDGEGVYIAKTGANSPKRILFVNHTSVKNHARGRNGSGMYGEEVAGLKIEQVTFSDNHAEVSGGGLYLTKCNVKHEENIYENNTAQTSGGGLFATQSKYTLASGFGMKKITCTSNTATLSGGCAHIEAAPNTAIVEGTYSKNGIANVDKIINADTQKGGAVYYATNSFAGALAGVAAVDNNAKFKINSAIFIGNRAKDAGGAVFTEHAFELLISNGKFTGNVTSDALSKGGAIASDFTKFNQNASFATGALVEINNDSVFENNSAGSDGGAVYFTNLKQLKASSNQITFVKNTSGGHGGALFVGFEPGNTAELWLSASASFERNHADTVGKQGGAVYVEPSPAKVQLYANFRENSAEAGGAGICLAGPQKINTLETSSLTVFENNVTATGNGGGLLVAADIIQRRDLSGTYKGNRTGNGEGGAVSFSGALPAGDFKTQAAKFDGNSATSNLAIHIADAAVDKFSFTRTTFANHDRKTPGCGSVMTLGNIQTFVIDNSGLPFDDSKINDNHAEEGGAFCFQAITNTLSLKNAVFEKNTATTGAGGLIKIATGNTTLDIKFDSVFSSENTAKGAGGVISVPKAYRLTTQAGTFTGNKADGKGGAVVLDEASELAIVGTNWTANDSKNDGGAVAMVKLGKLTMQRAVMGGNHADGNGGAIAIDEVTNQIRIESPKLGMWAGAGSPSLWQTIVYRLVDPNDNTRPAYSSIHGNTANGNLGGGAFYFKSTGPITITGQVWIENNTAGSGGALYAENVNGDVTIDSSLMYGNTALNNGGALIIVDLKNHDFTIGHNDQLRNGDLVSYFGDPHVKLASLDGVLPIGEVLRAWDLNAINEFGKVTPLDSVRGIFLVHKNTATQGHGGAFSIHNVKNINISRIPFGENKAPLSLGGTMLVSLNNKATITETIVYGGEARDTGGGIYLQGLIGGANAELAMVNSSIQKSKVTQAGVNCGGGMVVDTFKGIDLNGVSFYDNEVQSQNAANICAGALRFVQLNPIAGEYIRLKSSAPHIVPAFRFNLEGNRVLGNFDPGSFGAILIPSNVYDAFIAGRGLLISGTRKNNQPEPIGPYLGVGRGP